MTYSKVKVAFMAIVLALSSAFCFAQNSQETASSVSAQSEQSIALNQSQLDESSYALVLPENNSNQNRVSGIGVFFRMILVLAFVVAAIYFVFRFMKKTINPEVEEKENPFLRQVAGLSLAPGKSVQVVTIVDHAYVLGVSEESVNLIEKIDDKELVQAMNLYADKVGNTTKPKSFAEVLEIFMPNSNKTQKEETVYESNTSDLINSIKSQRIDSGAEK